MIRFLIYGFKYFLFWLCRGYIDWFIESFDDDFGYVFDLDQQHEFSWKFVRDELLR